MPWRDASPENERYYQDFVALWNLTEGGDAVAIRPPPAVADILEGDAAADPDVVLLSSRSRGAHRAARARWWKVPAAAAAAAAVVGFSIWTATALLTRPTPAPLALGADEFVTGIAETATVGLRDGSVVRLAPEAAWG